MPFPLKLHSPSSMSRGHAARKEANDHVYEACKLNDAKKSKGEESYLCCRLRRVEITEADCEYGTNRKINALKVRPVFL